VTETEEGASGPRMTQLDGLRAFAALAVVVHHYPPFPMGDHIDLGAAGVRMFFVLSGFLITGILLRARDEPEERSSRFRQLGLFYARRSLRIFPLYYATLFAVSAIDGRVRAYLPWYSSYLTNFAVIRYGQGTLPLSYFWTLAIEEQFYLFWPALILYSPRRWLPVLLALVTVSGPISRVALWSLTENFDAAIYATPSTLDSLGLGAILAWLSASSEHAGYRKGFASACLAMGAMLFAAGEMWRPLLGNGARFAVSLLGMNLVFVWMVDRAARGFQGLAGVVLGNRAMGYVGMISYGLYVFHPIVFRLFGALSTPALGHPVDLKLLPEPVKFVLVMLLSLAVASVSWFAFERPINNLKRFFPYHGHPPKAALPGHFTAAGGMGGTSPCASPALDGVLEQRPLDRDLS
jgi:peptidoglycan/LPS O-acetylase OafA/YrhL